MAKSSNPIWSFFSSVYLTLTILVLMVILSVAGTFIPQQDAARELAQGMTSGLSSFLHAMQLFDLFHSVWLFILMLLLFLNLIVCSLNRWPLTWKQFRKKPPLPGEGFFSGPDREQILLRREDMNVMAERLGKLLPRHYKQLPQPPGREHTVVFFVEKGRYSRFAVYVVHLSVLLLILGGITGAFWGWEGYINIGEGETADAVDLKGGKGVKPLPFVIRCDRFIVEYYEGGIPKTYRSDLTFFNAKGGKTIHQGSLLVNHPISLEGVRVYQAGYGKAPDGRVSLSFSKEGQQGQIVKGVAGETFSLPDQEGTVRIVRLEENLMEMGPAAKLLIRSDRREASFWVFQHIDKIREMNPGVMEQVPMFNPALFKPYVFALNGMETSYYTGLQVSRDPGTPLVAAAALFMVAGLLGTFFSSHRRLWIEVRQKGEQTNIRIAAETNKHSVVLDREVRRLAARIKSGMETEKS